MIRKLRFRFVAISTSLLFSLLFVLIFVTSSLNYNSVLAYSDTVIGILSDNRGTFPDPEKMEALEKERPLSKELPYETRYFSVLTDTDGTVLSSDTSKIATVDSETAVTYAQKVLDSGTQSGFIGTFRYAVSSNSSGKLIIFLDCERKLHDFYSFMWTSIWITFVGYAIVFILIVFFSGQIVKPFADNYERQKLFITDAEHELKTPLAIIDADAEVLGMEIGENEWLEDIQKQTKRLTIMTNALVYLSRMEEADSKLQSIDFPLSDVVAETAQSFQSLAISQGKTFQLDIEPMLSFFGDAKAFYQLTSILLDNAVKYSGDGGEIQLSLHRVNSSIRLSVQNTAEPISNEDLKHLFDRFYRTDKSRNTETGGHGIGLSIARAIVTAHKGTIKASAPDCHSLRITASFPIQH